MNIFAKSLAGLIAAVLTCNSLFAADPIKPLAFNTTAPTNDLKGSLAAQVQFAQSQILPAHPRKGDNQPHLTGYRKSLLLVRPLKADGATPMSVTARDSAGKLLGSIDLKPPEKLAKTAYFLDGVPDGKLDFTPQAGPNVVIHEGRDLEKLTQPNGTFLTDRLKQSALVEIQTADGRWVRDIYVPKGPALEGKMVRIRSKASYNSTVHYSGRGVTLIRDQTLQFKYMGGQWIREGELDNNRITYANDTWSGVLPAEWIVPGLKLDFRQATWAAN